MHVTRPPTPPPTPAPPTPPPTLVGCYVDDQPPYRPHDLPVNAGDLKTTDSPAACAAECAALGAFEFIGLQNGSSCFCGHEYGSQGRAANSSAECGVRCPGDPTVMCGGPGRNSVYATHVPPAPAPPAPPAAVPVPASALSAAVPAAQATRLGMQRELLHGRWNTWAKGSLTAHALLPHGIMIKLGICGADGACDEEASKAMVDSGAVRLGSHAYDHSYTQLYMAARGGCNVSVETAQLGGAPGADWVALLTPVSQAACAGASALAAVLFTDDLTSMCAAWRRYGNVSGGVDPAATGPVAAGGSVRAVPDGAGLGGVTLWSDAGAPVAPNASGADVRQAHYLLNGLGAGAVAFGTGAAPRTTAQVAALVGAARAAERASYAPYAAAGLAEAKEMSQAGMMWNVLYSLEIPGTFAPVSRGWGQPWVIFDWDNIFGAYQLSLDARELAYSQLVAVIKTKTANGMVPNFWQPQQISYDRTEPPIGAKVLHEMYGRWGDSWIVELLFDDLDDWVQWFFRRRVLRGAGGAELVVLGSDNVPGTTDSPDMQAARYESGLDNSPMYDGDGYFALNATTGDGKMLQFDVGMASMVAMELQALADLALAAFAPPRAADHARLSAQLAGLKAQIAAHLWNEELGIFANKFTNGTFHNRISPTSFYPMQARIATDAQAASMVEKWLTPKDKFCIAVDGDSKGNDDSCHWGLPSISADDAAFPPLGYWRGYVWGPMAQLTYWSLQQYPHVPVVAKGRAALAKQMTAMGMDQWHKHHHVCENYNPGFTAANKGEDCTGDHFYHW